MTNVQPVLECRDVSISYFTRMGEVPAVKGFNLKLMPGEAHGIVGESGCGKSTVALAIMNYMGRNGAIVGGEILFEGRDIRRMSEKELRGLRGSKISMVYQEPMASLNPSMRISDQLAEVLILHEGVRGKIALERAAEMLTAVRLPDPGRILNAYPHQISGGQQQRCVIAMALLAKPKLLLLDEPTTALDVTVEAGIVELIKEISGKFGTSMIYISHNLGLIRETCNKITVMYSGQAVEVGKIGTVFNNMRHPYTQGLFSSIPLPGADKNARPLLSIPGQLPLPHQRPPGCTFGPRCAHFEGGRCDKPGLPIRAVGDEPGHEVRCARFEEIDWGAAAKRSDAREAVVPGDVVLTVDHLKKHYEVSRGGAFGGSAATVKANEDLSFVAREAETVAIVGESGCGKSTFAKVVMGLEASSSGAVTLGNLEIGAVPVRSRDTKTISKMQMVFQNPFDTLNPSHSVGGQIARAVKKFGVEKDKRKIKARVLELLDIVKLPHEFARRRPRQLSGGQKQRIGIARAFAGSPKLVVADEPVSALDVSVQAAVTELLMDIQRKSRTTMLFISHDLSVVRYLADRIVVMYLGRIMEQGGTEAVFAPPYHPYTEALLAAVPIADTRVEKRKVVLTGELPSPLNPPKGCVFSTRCPYMMKGKCDTTEPPTQTFGTGHAIACHLSREKLLAMQPVITFKATGGGAPPMPPTPQGGAKIEAPAVLVGAPEPTEQRIVVKATATPQGPAPAINGTHVKLSVEERARQALDERSGADANKAKSGLGRQTDA